MSESQEWDLKDKPKTKQRKSEVYATIIYEWQVNDRRNFLCKKKCSTLIEQYIM